MNVWRRGDVYRYLMSIDMFLVELEEGGLLSWVHLRKSRERFLSQVSGFEGFVLRQLESEEGSYFTPIIPFVSNDSREI